MHNWIGPKVPVWNLLFSYTMHSGDFECSCHNLVKFGNLAAQGLLSWQQCPTPSTTVLIGVFLFDLLLFSLKTFLHFCFTRYYRHKKYKFNSKYLVSFWFCSKLLIVKLSVVTLSDWQTHGRGKMQICWKKIQFSQNNLGLGTNAKTRAPKFKKQRIILTLWNILSLW